MALKTLLPSEHPIREEVSEINPEVEDGQGTNSPPAK